MNVAVEPLIWEPKKRSIHIPFEVTSDNCHYIPLKFVPQCGPQCGFAALSMIASSVGVNLHPNELVAQAKLKNFTHHGEMFSAQNMADLARECLLLQFNVTMKSHSIKGLSNRFKNHLRNDNLILLPYDCDLNNEPCLRSGATAHWAVICGYVDGGNEDNFYILACHGKSRYVAAWKFVDLQQSNDNLQDLGVKRKSDKNFYLIPEGGLREGISSKWILFERKINYNHSQCNANVVNII